MSQIVVTGSAGFIGFHLCRKLLERGDSVTGVDCLNDYYDVTLKQDRLAQLAEHPNFAFRQFNLVDADQTSRLVKDHADNAVVHLAAQVGVRYSLDNPHAYAESNLVAFLNVLEACRHSDVGHLVYASSSSVYGANDKVPFAVTDPVERPISLYAATKRAGEVMAHSYTHLFGLRTTGLRFFTVYGPWGRPDMAVYRFTEALLAGKPLPLFGKGELRRDFTYVDDVVGAILGALASGELSAPQSPLFRLYNVGGNRTVSVNELVSLLEKELGVSAIREHLPMQPGDMPETYADIDASTSDLNYHPETPIEEGIGKFVTWYRSYQGV